MRIALTGAHVVLEDRIVHDGCVVIEDATIVAVEEGGFEPDCPTQSLQGCWLLPGLIDLHCDVIEKDVEVRPGVYFPLQLAIELADRRCAMTGITTEFHGISFGHQTRGLHNTALAADLVRQLRRQRESCHIDNRILLRYEIADALCVPTLIELINERCVDLFSFMDHTPASQTFTAVESMLMRSGVIPADSTHNLTDDDNADTTLHIVQRMRTLTRLCHDKAIPIGTHDDKTIARLHTAASLGATLSEFPHSAAIGHAAQARSITPLVGAPNAIRGESHLQWLDARSALASGAATVLVSDYHPTLLLSSLFAVADSTELPLAAAVRSATLAPATAVGLTDRGSIAVGKRADLVAARYQSRWAHAVATWVGGKMVYRSTGMGEMATQTIDNKNLLQTA
jgi:alpha-D-ribose 1-methylphosphonate 5-triphosphate diphosphatase